MQGRFHYGKVVVNLMVVTVLRTIRVPGPLLEPVRLSPNDMTAPNWVCPNFVTRVLHLYQCPGLTEAAFLETAR